MVSFLLCFYLHTSFPRLRDLPKLSCCGLFAPARCVVLYALPLCAHLIPFLSFDFQHCAGWPSCFSSVICLFLHLLSYSDILVTGPTLFVLLLLSFPHSLNAHLSFVCLTQPLRVLDSLALLPMFSHVFLSRSFFMFVQPHSSSDLRIIVPISHWLATLVPRKFQHMLSDLPIVVPAVPPYCSLCVSSACSRHLSSVFYRVWPQLFLDSRFSLVCVLWPVLICSWLNSFFAHVQICFFIDFTNIHFVSYWPNF